MTELKLTITSPCGSTATHVVNIGGDEMSASLAREFLTDVVDLVEEFIESTSAVCPDCGGVICPGDDEHHGQE